MSGELLARLVALPVLMLLATWAVVNIVRNARSEPPQGRVVPGRRPRRRR